MSRYERLSIPSDATFMWRIVYSIAWLVLAPLCCRLRVTGRDNVPKTGGCIIASNHNPGFDFVLLGLAAPRQVYYMAKSEAFRNPLLHKFLLSVGTFPVERGGRDRKAMQSAIDFVQKEGHILGMFPEGTRSRTGVLGRGKSGVSRIAMETGAPVVPAVVINSEKALKRFGHFPRTEVFVKFGEPIYCTGDASDTAAVRTNTQRIMYAIAQLLPPERRGEHDRLIQAAQEQRVETGADAAQEADAARETAESVAE